MFSVGYEAGIVWRFLDGVSSAVSARMATGSSPTEENLTFLLCELLDANSTSLHALSYSLSQAQADLDASDSGIALEVEFQTHEHSRYVESSYSAADLGIVLAINHPVLGHSRRGFLVQAKRLFGRGRKREYGLLSDYSSFDRKQADFLKKITHRFNVSNSVFYLWYNPPSTAFPDVDAKILRAYDSGPAQQSWNEMYRVMEMSFPFSVWGIRAASGEDEVRARQWRVTQPALRVSALNTACSVGEHGPPQLKALYDAMLKRHSSLAFSPFADFFVTVLTNSAYGSANPDWLRLTEGEKVRMPVAKTADGANELDQLESPPIPRHTLRINVGSTLPHVG